jgi:hypothetical protein
MFLRKRYISRKHIYIYICTLKFIYCVIFHLRLKHVANCERIHCFYDKYLTVLTEIFFDILSKMFYFYNLCFYFTIHIRSPHLYIYSLTHLTVCLSTIRVTQYFMYEKYVKF